jgi:chromosome segregation ATPase
MSAYSNGSNTSRGSSLSHGSSVSRWKLDEQKRRLRECRRRASGCVQEIKIMKEECTLLSAAITEQERTQQSLQEQRDKLQTSTTGESPSQSCTISQVGIFEEMQSSVSVCW